ncbi:hypothetical protein PC128_g17544 [Phytophthora cactorum]|nr:hypothetical protein C6341_g16427 [Phytophthora cactorum]KAG3175826.1 hypothetical protein PC128_g17544 [Phytophthora cactorum]KAG4049825.1 hypothetical protein PC123_g14897 [Phytophthora cactorum]
MDFCQDCMKLAMKLSAWSIALETLPKSSRGVRRNKSFSSSATKALSKSLSKSTSATSSN